MLLSDDKCGIKKLKNRKGKGKKGANFKSSEGELGKRKGREIKKRGQGFQSLNPNKHKIPNDNKRYSFKGHV